MTPRTAARQASLSFTVSWSLLRLMSIELVMPSNHLILCRALLLPSVFPSIGVFFGELTLRSRWSECWSFSISPSSEYSGLIFFRIDWFDLLCCAWDSEEFSPAPQFKSISSLAVSLFYGPTLTSVHDSWKNRNSYGSHQIQHISVTFSLSLLARWKASNWELNFFVCYIVGVSLFQLILVWSLCPCISIPVFNKSITKRFSGSPKMSLYVKRRGK